MEHKSKKPVTLAKWIWRSYLKTALIPVILIELVFLGIYFSINIIMKNQLYGLVNTAVNKQVSLLANLEASAFDDQLESVEINTGTFAAQMERALRLPAELSAEDQSRLRTSPDGVYYTASDSGGAAVFYSGAMPVGASERDKVARVLTMQGLMKDICRTNPMIASIYLNTGDSLNVIYPYIDVLKQYTPKVDVTAFNFYYEGDAAHDPSRAQRWTALYLDPAGHGWITTCLAPVYNGETLEGVVGTDVSIDNLAAQLHKISIPLDGYALLAGGDGSLLAVTDRGTSDWPLMQPPAGDAAAAQDTFAPDSANLNQMPDIAGFSEVLRSNSDGVEKVPLGGEFKRVFWSTVGETGWKLMLVIPEKSITGTIDRVGSGVQKIGAVMTVGMIVFAMVLLHILFVRAKKMSLSLSQPLVELDGMAERIGAGDYYQEMPQFGVKELQETSASIVSMGQRLGSINRYLLSTQTELKEKEKYLQAVLYSIDDTIVELDENGVITNLFINDPENMPASRNFSSIDSIFDKSRVGLITEKLREVVATGQTATIEIDVQTVTGLRWSQARLSLVSRDPARIVVTARDITERKEMEASILKAKDEAEAANRAKSQFLSSMSHELRTPLNAVLGFAQVLELDPSAPLNGMQQECVYEIMKAGNHLLELITEVLDLARIEAGKTRLSIEPVDIAIIIEETMAIIIPTAEKYGVRVSSETGSCGPMYVKADKTKLKQILINLLSNAVKYNKPGGKVDYYCQVEGGVVRFQVTDTGVGIPENELEAIFKPFYRLSSTKNLVEGTGVGLAVVKQLTEMMGGTVRAESTEGQGSRFTVELPAAEEMTLWSEWADIPSTSVSAHVIGASNKKILYIEDNDANLRLVMRILELVPQTSFLSAPTAEAGIEAARREKPDVILMDINLPGMDGYEAFMRLRSDAETRNIPVIAVSSNAMEREIARAVELGFYDYITKPIKADIFIERIKRVFGSENERT